MSPTAAARRRTGRERHLVRRTTWSPTRASARRGAVATSRTARAISSRPPWPATASGGSRADSWTWPRGSRITSTRRLGSGRCDRRRGRASRDRDGAGGALPGDRRAPSARPAPRLPRPVSPGPVREPLGCPARVVTQSARPRPRPRRPAPSAAVPAHGPTSSTAAPGTTLRQDLPDRRCRHHATRASPSPRYPHHAPRPPPRPAHHAPQSSTAAPATKPDLVERT